MYRRKEAQPQDIVEEFRIDTDEEYENNESNEQQDIAEGTTDELEECTSEDNKYKKKKIITKKKIISFVDFLIVLCLLMCAIVTFTVLYEYHRLDMVMQAGEIGAILAVWGGELLLIVIRQVLGSDIRKNREENNG